MARKHNTPAERINRIIVALYEIKNAATKNGGKMANITLAFRRQQVAVMTKDILHDLMVREITPEYAQELIARDVDYRKRLFDAIRKRGQAAHDPATGAETAPQSTQQEQAINCPQSAETPAERDIFDLDETTCIDYLKSKGWQFAECHIATKWV